MSHREPDAETAHRISQALYRYCRGMDRMDAELTLTCFTPDAQLDYTSLFRGTAAGFVEWLWPIHARMVGHTHSISNILFGVAGDGAPTTEAYVMTTLRMEHDGALVDLVSTGRYLDRWVDSADGWVIGARSYIGDLATVRPVVKADLSAVLPRLPGPHPVRSARSHDDHSYALLAGLAPVS